MINFIPRHVSPLSPRGRSVVIPAQAGIPCAAGIILSPRCLTPGPRLINLSRSDTNNFVCAGAQDSIYLDPVVNQHPTKTFVFAGAPRHGMTSKKNAGHRGQTAPHKNIRFCGGPRPLSVVIPAQAGIHCAAGIPLVTPRLDRGAQVN